MNMITNDNLIWWVFQVEFGNSPFNGEWMDDDDNPVPQLAQAIICEYRRRVLKKYIKPCVDKK